MDKTTEYVVELMNKLIKERDPYKKFERVGDKRIVTTVSGKVYTVTAKGIAEP